MLSNLLLRVDPLKMYCVYYIYANVYTLNNSRKNENNIECTLKRFIIQIFQINHDE